MKILKLLVKTIWNLLAVLGIIVTAFVIILSINIYSDTKDSLNTLSKHVAKGNGMAPTIKKGDVFIVDKSIKDFQRGDIILYKIPNDSSYFQRIIAIPGDKIEIKRNKQQITEVYLNDKLLDETYKVKKKETSPHPKAIHFGPIVVEENHYFVLGDDRDLSYDSRFMGALDKNLIIGKVVKIVDKN